MYQDDGYLFFNIQPIEIQVDEDSVDVEMRITEGEQANINKVIVNGNTLTSDHVILRELRTMPGQKFSRSNIIRTQQELAQLGYFDPEKISIKPEPNPAEGTVNIQYKLEEKSSNQFELSGGWGGFYGFIGTLGLTINNFSLRKIFKEWRPIPQGDGQKLAIRFQSNGPRFQNYSISFTEPWLGGKKPHSFSVSLSHSLQAGGAFLGSVVTAPTSTTQSMQVTSATISFGRRLTFPDDRFTMINSLSFNRYKMNNWGIIPGFSSGISNNFSLNTTISRNSIDNPTYPRSGSSITFAVNLTPPYSMFMDRNWSDLTSAQRYEFVEYHKWMFDNSWYLKLAGNLVLRASSHIGFLGTYTDKVGSSPFERFVLGGSGMTFNNVILGVDNIALRGYPDQKITPVEYINGVKSTSGGVAYNKFVLELRYPISLQPSATVFVVTFAEAGNNWGAVSDMNPFDLKRSVGLGARIFMPAFGMLGFDYAWGFDNYPGKLQKGVEGQFHFTIGQQIR
ncbi:MAG: hypothetical protein EAZ97_11310 [Bacteroidetes bacterium]|nr:MAG: hypothetical protein EAZ97_11310 [Bacteroidota bacterium]